MIELVVYFVALIGFFLIAFKVLRAINIESMFKKGKVWEIQAFYIISSVVIAHILASVIVKFVEWTMIVIG